MFPRYDGNVLGCAGRFLRAIIEHRTDLTQRWRLEMDDEGNVSVFCSMASPDPVLKEFDAAFFERHGLNADRWSPVLRFPWGEPWKPYVPGSQDHAGNMDVGWRYSGAPTAATALGDQEEETSAATGSGRSTFPRKIMD
ncbi:MAG: hypothetical protein V1696_00340 [Candidatus Jorgensenbacteria bacterium]